ncbi:P-loop NTPase fold protein [Sphingobacterium sp. Ag1]|uniref:P-loop NTPase fold protein n=1 Tax=Sphingobacterium sp. Ag1 TaxID=1643451 RepID=UPI00069B434E|nr:P-loop NTPase fold protein [Sphingobacterium sp. Ag1]
MNIKNDTLLQDFLNHLELEGNNDIIFSAPFGTGKTYFLKEDFVPKCDEQYNAIHLYPVNYSVSSNEDIFELIKYDILFELVLKYKDSILNIDELELDKGLALQLYMQDNFKALDFTQQVFKATTKLGKSISDILDLLKLEKSKFDEFYGNLKANEFTTIKTYLESFENGKGLKEFDAISALISEILGRLKSETKQNVLIIDDLDRIDPEHIFRIFNVLSAHRDYHTSKNKFGFDKVILVCDIENIKRIYEHRYGKYVDFQGYINKFYSKSIYSFNNARYIRGALRDYLDELQYEDFPNDLRHFRLNSRNGDGFYKSFLYLLQIFVEHRKLSLRSLKNIQKIPLTQYNFFDKESQTNDNIVTGYGFLVLIQYMSILFGSRQPFIKAVKELKEEDFIFDFHSLNVESYYYNMFLKNFFAMVINVIQMNRMKEEVEGLEFYIWGTDKKIPYNVKRYNWNNYVIVTIDNDDSFHDVDVIDFLDKSLTIVENRKLLS